MAKVSEFRKREVQGISLGTHREHKREVAEFEHTWREDDVREENPLWVSKKSVVCTHSRSERHP